MSDDEEVQTWYEQLRQKEAQAIRLSLIEWDEAAYQSLRHLARRIVPLYTSRPPQWQRQARRIFLAFVMAFAKSNQRYISDDAFWPDLEHTLGLGANQRRNAMDDWLWQGYEEAGLTLSYDGRGRQIIGTLQRELADAPTWVAQARRHFVAFFKWYYLCYEATPVTAEMVERYNREEGERLTVPQAILPALSQDCQALARVIAYAMSQAWQLESLELDKYCQQIVQALGEPHNPAKLRLLRDRQQLIGLIRALQNHRTPAQFRRLLEQHPIGQVITPDGERVSVVRALERYSAFPYGLYQVGRDEYRVVPDPRLSLEALVQWPWEQVITYRSGHLLYKKQRSFEVQIGRRRLTSHPLKPQRGRVDYVWAGAVPKGEKLVIDGRPQSESAGAAWELGVQLHNFENGALAIQIEKLVLYYPMHPHGAVVIRTSNGYEYTSHLQADGVRRFHRHAALGIPLSSLDVPVRVTVEVAGESVLEEEVVPYPCQLFSAHNGELIQARRLAEGSDDTYLLYARAGMEPRVGEGVILTERRTLLEGYRLYEVEWEDTRVPFHLRVGTDEWHFERRQSLIPFILARPMPPYLRLKPHQIIDFRSLTLALVTTLRPERLQMSVVVEGEEIATYDLAAFLRPANPSTLYSLPLTLLEQVEQAVRDEGHYTFLFSYDGRWRESLSLSRLPSLTVQWDTQRVYGEGEEIPVQVRTLSVIGDPPTRQKLSDSHLTLTPRFARETWSEQPGLTRFFPEMITEPLFLPTVGEGVEITIRPRLFGIRLYLHHPPHSYQPIRAASYDTLAHTAIQLIAPPAARLTLHGAGVRLWEGEVSEAGNLLLTELDFLRDYCQTSETVFTFSSGAVSTPFIVHWLPRLHGMRLEAEGLEVDYQGPRGAEIELRWQDLQGHLYQSRRLACAAKREIARVTAKHPGPEHYVTAQYHLPNGQTRPAAWQVRVAEQATRLLPLEWLLAGVGFADEEGWSQWRLPEGPPRGAS